MNPIDLIGGFYTVDGLSWACQDTVNYLPMRGEAAGTKTPAMLKTPPGLKPYVNIGDAPSFAIRGMHDVEGALFVVSGRKLYQITNKQVAIPIGTIPGVGRVSMAHNQITGGNELLVVNGTAGYVYNTVTQGFERVTDEGYPGSFLADYIDSYLMQVEPFGRFLFHSNLADATDYNTLDRFEAETYPDKVVSMLVDHQEVWAFGERSIDLFENSGSATGTFVAKGISIEQGCAGRFTPAKLDNSVFWLGNDGIVYRADGYNPVRVSTHAIEDAIADNDWSQAFAFTWSSKGHKVYYLTFPDGQTWGFDVSSGLWHRRATYTPAFEVSRRWRLNDLVYSNGKWIGGDSLSGRLYVLDWDYMLDDQSELVSERVSPIVYNSGSRFTVDAVELLMRTGEKPTAAAEFPIQPPSPTITGDAPNGVVSFPWGPYSYTGSGGTGVLTYSIRDGELPPSYTFNTTLGRINAATPEAAGSYSFTVRVTDETGLWDEITDGITIAAYNESFMAADAAQFYQYKRDGAGFALEQDYTKGTFPASQLSLSKGGRYAVMPSLNTPYLEIYRRSDLGIYTMLATPIASMPAAPVYSGCISSDSNYLFLAVGTSWQFYKRDGDEFDLIYTHTAANRTAEFGAMWSPDGKWLVACENGTGAIKQFKRTADVISAPIVTSTPAASAVAWTADSKRIAVTIVSAAIAVYSVSDTGLVRLDGTSVIPDSNPNIAWSPDGDYIYSRGSGSPPLRVYRWTGTQVIAQPDPADQPLTSATGSLNLHIEGGLLLVSSGANPGTFVYTVDGPNLTKIDPSGVTTGIVPRLSFLFSAEHAP